MPKDTFLNLPESKRRLIEEVALSEFGEFGFEKASINRIVNGANIAKGSFYQYFEDKGDVFTHIMQLIGTMKLDYISPILQNPEGVDFFTFLEEIYRSGLAFAKDHTHAARVGFEVYKNRSNPLFEEIYLEGQRQGMAFYAPLIDRSIEKGELDPNINKTFVIHMLIYLQVAAFDYYLENEAANKHDDSPWAGDIMPTINLMINFIKNGIQSPRKGASSND
jgi:AcrR family transcriptional regulator